MLEWHDLNARHQAIALWWAVILVIAMIKSPEFRRSIRSLIRSLLSPSILVPMLGLLAYVTLLTVLGVTSGRIVGLWKTLPVVTAALWLLTTGFSLLLHVGDFLRTDNEFRSRAIAILVPSTIFTQVAGVAILHFVWELFLVPVLVILVYAAHANQTPSLTNFSRGLLAFYAIALITLVAINLFVNPEDWRNLLQAILFPIFLTIGTLPYIKLLTVWERIKFTRSANCKIVRSSDYGPDWPLTVDSAKLCCKGPAVWVEVNDMKYGVNGFAGPILQGWGHAVHDLNDIWKDHPQRQDLIRISGTDDEATRWKVSVGRLIQDGLDLGRQS